MMRMIRAAAPSAPAMPAVVAALAVIAALAASCTPTPLLSDFLDAARDNPLDPGAASNPAPTLGAAWTKSSVSLPEARHLFASTIQAAGDGSDNLLWIYGGCDPSNAAYYTLRSFDGAAWTSYAAESNGLTPPAFPTGGPGTFIFFANKSIYAFGGKTAVYDSTRFTGYLMYDVAAGTWSDAGTHLSVAHSTSGTALFGESVYFIAGETGSASVSEYADTLQVLSGYTATVATLSSVGLSPRKGHQAIVFKDRLYVIGGQTSATTMDDSVYARDTASSSFSLVADAPGFEPRRDFALVVADPGAHSSTVASDPILYLIGGAGLGSTHYDDVWFTRDGANWYRLVEHAEFTPRSGMRAEYYKGSLYLMGGYDYIAEVNSPVAEVWVSAP